MGVIIGFVFGNISFWMNENVSHKYLWTALAFLFPIAYSIAWVSL